MLASVLIQYTDVKSELDALRKWYEGEKLSGPFHK